MRRGSHRYNSLNRFLRDKFGEKVFKVTLDAGLDCPNRDGTKGTGGCIYCNPESGLPVTWRQTTMPISQQLIKGIEYVRQRHGAAKFISYFQQHTNTYAHAKKLEALYHDALSHKDIVGLSIATRPDCISDDVYKLLAKLNKETYLWVELGLQSANEPTLKLINRGHTTKEFLDALYKLKSLSITVCAHIIIGLPGETRGDMLKTAKFINEHNLDGVKIHNLHILKDTRLEEMYRKKEITPLTLDEYMGLVIDTLENLSPNILIHRFSSHSPRHLTVAPEWSINKLNVLNYIEGKLEERDSWQGKSIGAKPPIV